jgi:hypothetical protein
MRKGVLFAPNKTFRYSEEKMGFRFSRRIKIAKGLRLNVSKSGLGLSVGGRGASYSLGPRGLYGNFGIPGTGLSVRSKLGGGNVRGSRSNAGTKQIQLNVKATISIDDETGKETIALETDDGTPICDDYVLRKVKKTEAFKQKLQETRNKTVETVAEKTDVLVNIHTRAEPIVSLQEVQAKAGSLKPRVYTRNRCPEPKPDRSQLDLSLQAIAKKEVRSWKFWKLKQLRQEFVQHHIQTVYDAALKDWEKTKQAFEAQEDKREKVENARYLQEFENEKASLAKILSGNDNYIQSTLDDVLSEIQLPVNFELSYKVKNSQVEVDLDLPEIEDYPINKAAILESGKLSIKKKAKSELNSDYARSVFGLAFYFASIIFNISPAIQTVKISGYTQRINKKIGKAEDQYIYSINFDRKIFASLDFQKIDPLLAVANFEHVKDITRTLELRTICPLS